MISRFHRGSVQSKFTDGQSVQRVEEEEDEEDDQFDGNYLKRLEQPSASDYNKNQNRPYSTTQRDNARFGERLQEAKGKGTRKLTDEKLNNEPEANNGNAQMGFDDGEESNI